MSSTQGLWCDGGGPGTPRRGAACSRSPGSQPHPRGCVRVRQAVCALPCDPHKGPGRTHPSREIEGLCTPKGSVLILVLGLFPHRTHRPSASCPPPLAAPHTRGLRSARPGRHRPQAFSTFSPSTHVSPPLLLGLRVAATFPEFCCSEWEKKKKPLLLTPL